MKRKLTLGPCHQNHRCVFPHRHRVYVTFVAGERLLALSVANVPELGGRVAGTAHERSALRRERQGHHVSGVTEE